MLKAPKWVMYHDPSFYDCWAVRDDLDKSFNSPRLFHFIKEEDANEFLRLIKKAGCGYCKED